MALPALGRGIDDRAGEGGDDVGIGSTPSPGGRRCQLEVRQDLGRAGGGAFAAVAVAVNPAARIGPRVHLRGQHTVIGGHAVKINVPVAAVTDRVIVGFGHRVLLIVVAGETGSDDPAAAEGIVDRHFIALQGAGVAFVRCGRLNLAELVRADRHVSNGVRTDTVAGIDEAVTAVGHGVGARRGAVTVAADVTTISLRKAVGNTFVGVTACAVLPVHMGGATGTGVRQRIGGTMAGAAVDFPRGTWGGEKGCLTPEAGGHGQFTQNKVVGGDRIVAVPLWQTRQPTVSSTAARSLLGS